MNMIKFFITSALIVAVSLLQAQTPEIPAEYEWTVAEDYRKAESHIEKCLKWLCVTPLGEHVALRSETNAYVLTWLSGTPDYAIDVPSYYVQLIGENKELLYSYIHGAAYYLMNHITAKNPDKIDLEACKVVCELMLSSEKFSKDRTFKSMLKAYKKGKLEAFVKEQKAGK
ncbi:MAG: hypothetical protein R2809_06895 [Flavobacteriales bacterium]